jgi:hypothetical protein
MASTYSTNLALELIGIGDQPTGTWGAVTNTNLGTLLEQAISGYTTQAVATGTDTTITIPNGATGVARNMFIELSGTGGASTNLIVPANRKLYFIYNPLAGQVTVKVSGQTGVSVPAGKKVILVCNGTDIIDATNYMSGLTVGTLNGVLKGTTGVVSAATAGTDYVAPGTATTFTATQTFNGTSSTAALKETNIIEPANLVATVGGPAITTQFYINSGAVQYYTANNSLNWTLNLTFSAGTTLNTAMAVNDSITCTLITTNTTTAYYLSTITVDTSATVTTKWQGGTAPASGNASSLDSYTFVIIKTAASTFTVLASQTKFA